MDTISQLPSFRRRQQKVKAVVWLGFEKGPHDLGIVPFNADGFGWIDTIQGGFIVHPHDWVIIKEDGTKYPVAPATFSTEYELCSVSLREYIMLSAIKDFQGIHLGGKWWQRFLLASIRLLWPTLRTAIKNMAELSEVLERDLRP